MATTAAPRRGSIADDWSEVDAAESVRSLPTSDDEPHFGSSDDDQDLIDLSGDLEPSSSPSPKRRRNPSADTAPKTPDEPPPAWSPVAGTEAAPVAIQPSPPVVQAQPIAAPAKVTEAHPPSRSYSADVEAVPLAIRPITSAVRAQPVAITPTDTEEKSDLPESPVVGHDFAVSSLHGQANTNDPVLYRETLDTVVRTVFEMKQLFWEPSVSTSMPLRAIEPLLVSFSMHAAKIMPILVAYAEHWVAHGSGMAAGEIPVNADLLQWMTELNARLGRLQFDIKHGGQLLAVADTPDGVSPAAWNLFNGHYLALKQLDDTMADFLPIIKVDFDTFRASHLHFPESVPDARPRRQSHREAPRPEVVRLRRELYDLKDQIETIRRFFFSFLEFVPPSRIPGVSDAVTSVDTTSSIIATILSNHGSDWIESDMNWAQRGILSYRDFVALSPDVLHDITGHLKQFCEELNIDQDDEESQLIATPYMIRNHQTVMLTAGGQLQELISIMAFLQSLLRPGTEPTSPPRQGDDFVQDTRDARLVIS